MMLAHYTLLQYSSIISSRYIDYRYACYKMLSNIIFYISVRMCTQYLSMIIILILYFNKVKTKGREIFIDESYIMQVPIYDNNAMIKWFINFIDHSSLAEGTTFIGRLKVIIKWVVSYCILFVCFIFSKLSLINCN